MSWSWNFTLGLGQWTQQVGSYVGSSTSRASSTVIPPGLYTYFPNYFLQYFNNGTTALDFHFSYFVYASCPTPSNGASPVDSRNCLVGESPTLPYRTCPEIKYDNANFLLSYGRLVSSLGAGGNSINSFSLGPATIQSANTVDLSQQSNCSLLLNVIEEREAGFVAPGFQSLFTGLIALGIPAPTPVIVYSS
jgi:hypothetical protein